MNMEQCEAPVTFGKCGFCKTEDANDRFTQEYLTNREKKYWGTALGIDYEIDTLWSGYFYKKDITKLEQAWKGLSLEKVTGMNQYNGYTECRVMSLEEAFHLQDLFKGKFPKAKYGYEKGKFKLYFVVGAKKGTPEGDIIKNRIKDKDKWYAEKRAAKV